MAIINGTAASDFLNGTALADTIDGKAGEDILSGNDGNDSIVGGAGRDELYGGDGDDILRGGADSDFFEGGTGNDTIDGSTVLGDLDDGDGVGFFSATVGVNVNLATGVATDGLGGTDTLIDIEEVYGSDFNDTITGGNAANDDYEYFEGGRGNDTINGGSGIDWAGYLSDFGNSGLRVGIVANMTAGTVRDGYGNVDRLFNIEVVEATRFSDSLTGSTLANEFLPSFGSDFVDGGAGIDTVSYLSDFNYGSRHGLIRRPGIDADLALGTSVDLGGRVDTLVRIENIVGSQLNDQLRGNAVSNVLEGIQGDDILSGRGGNDTCSGGYGQDRLFGGAGNDILAGGRGDDYLHGGANADTFVFAEIADYDVIRDFTTGADKIDVSDYGFASGAAVLALAVQRGASVIITLNADSIIELANTNLAGGLTATDFII